jgi:hypothetical protein
VEISAAAYRVAWRAGGAADTADALAIGFLQPGATFAASAADGTWALVTAIRRA